MKSFILFLLSTSLLFALSVEVTKESDTEKQEAKGNLIEKLKSQGLEVYEPTILKVLNPSSSKAIEVNPAKVIKPSNKPLSVLKKSVPKLDAKPKEKMTTNDDKNTSKLATKSLVPTKISSNNVYKFTLTKKTRENFMPLL